LSVEFNAVMTRAVAVGDLLSAAGTILVELTGIDEAPPTVAVVGNERRLGRVVGAGQTLGPDRLATTWLGPGVPDPHLEIFDDAGTELAQLVVSAAPDAWIVTVSPGGPARAIVSGLAFACAAALLGDGQVVDNDLRLTDGYEHDIGGFVAATRLPPGPRTLDGACLEYLRRFPQLEGWPPS